jgi:hypothetical protein
MLVAFGLVGSVSAIEVNENLSVNGFIDGSYVSQDFDATANDNSNIGIDEIEIDFLFNAGGVSGELHLDNRATGAPAGTQDLNIEQAHFSYGFEGGLILTVGRFGSNLGLEREDPSGLYTYSRAYGDDFNLGDVDTHAQEGLSVSYSQENMTVGVSAYNAVGAAEEAAGVDNDLDYEISVAFTGIENLSLGAGFQSTNAIASAADEDVTNIHAAYTSGKLLIAAEWTNIDDAAADRDAWALVADYDVSDVLGVAVRYSEEEVNAATEDDRLTIAPNYSITDSLGAILEYSSSTVAGADDDTLALELLFTF